MSLSEHPNAIAVRDLHALFCEGAFEQCLDRATEDVEVGFRPTGQTFRGREEFLQFMHMFRVAFPDIRIEHVNRLADGDQVAVEFRWSGTHTGPLVTPNGTIPPTGRRVTDAHVVEIVRVRDGKIARIANYQDIASWLRQIGIGPGA